METQRLIDCFVGMFTRTVRFGHFEFDTTEFSLPEYRNEKFIVIRDYVQRQTIFAIQVIEQQNSQILSGDVCPCGDNPDIRTDQ